VSGSSLLTTESAPFDVRPGEVAQVLLDVRLTFVAPSVEVPASPTDSVQPVSTSDMLSGTIMDIAPLEGDDFQSLLPMLPGVVRGQDGRLRVKGGQPTQGALQISSASLVDPSTGDFDLDLPGQSLESVEVLANPFAAEYGRFSTSVTQIRTKRGTNDWEIKPGNLVPRFRKGLSAIRAFEPRFSVRGPIRRDRIFLAQDFQFRYVTTPVKSLPDEPVSTLRSFDSFTRIDGVISSRHTLGGGVVIFPREIERVGMNTFRPPEVTPDLNQSGLAIGLVDRFAMAPDLVLESTLSVRRFELNVNTEGRLPMVFAPETLSGSFYNDQERDVHSVQLVEALSLSRHQWRGEHVFKFGVDLQLSGYDGFSTSRPVEIRRVDGSLAERTVFGETSFQEVNGTELAVFAQDRWRASSRVTFELGLRLDHDAIVERVNWSPRAGVSISVLPEGEGILRGGFGKFSQRTPLNIGAHQSFEPRTVTRFAPDGSPLGPAITFINQTAPGIKTPEALVGNVEWNQRFGRRLLLKTNFLHRQGSHEYVIQPDPPRGVIELSSTGSSRYWEFEVTGRYLGGERRDLTASYVRSHAVADLNSYDQFFGNLRNPVIRRNERNLTSTDVPHRLLVRGTIGLPGQWDFAPVLEIRSGFPWSAVDEFLDFIGPRNRTDRLPAVSTLDFSVSRPWRFKKYRFRAGIKVYNVFGVSANRDIQNNLTSPNYGQSFNPIERSIGFVLGSAR
jgi:outer membrane receptor protein involved in Fe transport